MTEAPERIWAYAGAFRMWREKYPEHVKSPAEYLRADHVDALLKAERDNALREAEKNLSVYAPSLVDGPEHDVGYYHGYVTALHRVLDLIAEDKTDE